MNSCGLNQLSYFSYIPGRFAYRKRIAGQGLALKDYNQRLIHVSAGGMIFLRVDGGNLEKANGRFSERA